MSLFSHRIHIRSDQPSHPGTRAATRRLVERRRAGNVGDASLQRG
jgi:hypothetical protein